MKPNVVKPGTVRLAASLAGLVLLASPALAGDRALFDAIGYSSDGRYFAFEEYGVQDGSGFAYSNIYVLDVPADRWVSGAPFSVRLEDDGAPLAEARDQALALAAGTLEDLAITGPVDLLALNGDGEPGDGQTLAYGLVAGYGLEAARDVATLSLESFAATGSTDCAQYTDQPILGFAINRDGVELYRDTSVPKSRGCALGYKLYAVVAPALFDPPQPAMVAIVSVYPLGFEGPDRRFIAVPIGN